ncbi:MAG: sulfotransferase, partial [Acidimicrobiia bacterium]
MTHPSSGIVFLLGVAPRSGTNFLEQLLALHPDCSPGVPLREDHVLHHSELLDAYVERLSDRWSRQPHWGVHAGLAEALRSHLGAGLSQFLRAQIEPPGLVDEVPEVMSDVHRLVKPSSRYLIAKTPRVSNLRNWLRYFPAAPAVILVRDGRSVAESTVRSWGSNWESVVQD